MKRLPILLVFAAAVAAYFSFAIAQITPSFAAQDDSSLTAKRVDGGIADPLGAAWSDVPSLAVSLDPEVEDAKLPTLAGVHYGPVANVNVQAVYDDKSIWIRSSWDDNTRNDNRGMWTYDGTKWVENPVHQDRLAFAFDITGNAQFTALGCGGACHEADSTAGDYMGFPPDSTDAIDVWQWKAANPGPAGLADDQWIGSYIKDSAEGPVADASDGGAPVANKNKAGDGPLFVYPAGAQPLGPLFTDTAVPIDPSMKFEAGYTVPGYVMSRYTGSRGDINAASDYVAKQDGTGTWYVVMSRPFNTGHPEDHVFTLNSSSVFGVAVFNAADDKEHATHDKLNLILGA